MRIPIPRKPMAIARTSVRSLVTIYRGPGRSIDEYGRVTADLDGADGLGEQKRRRRVGGRR